MTQAKLPSVGSILSIDYGAKRIGVAISDEKQTLSLPVKVILRDKENDLETIKNICQEKNCAGLVVGLPLMLDGNKGKSAHAALSFVGRLKACLPNIPITTHDERFSSMMAEELINKNNKSYKDAIAAQIILQDLLDTLKK